MTTTNSAAHWADAHPSSASVTVDDDAHLLASLRTVGQRHAPLGRCGEALVDYWRFVVQAPVARRAAVLGQLRQDLHATRLLPRACVPVALGDPDFELARAATRAWLGSGPTSLERRAQAVRDAIDWVARGLACNRAGVFCALLDVADEALLERLVGLRGRLAPHEAAPVLAVHDTTPEPGFAEFLADWRERLASLTPPSRPSPRPA